MKEINSKKKKKKEKVIDHEQQEYDEYYSFGSQALTAQLTLNDLQQDSWDVRLKVTIEGEGIRISTKQNFRPLNKITLIKGLTQIVEGDGFAEYVSVNNVDLEGITAAS